MLLLAIDQRDAELGQREGHQRHIDAALPQRQDRGQPAERGYRHHSEQQVPPDRHAELYRCYGGDIGGDAEEGDMGEIENARIAERKVPIRCDHRV